MVVVVLHSSPMVRQDAIAVQDVLGRWVPEKSPAHAISDPIGNNCRCHALKRTITTDFYFERAMHSIHSDTFYFRSAPIRPAFLSAPKMTSRIGYFYLLLLFYVFLRVSVLSTYIAMPSTKSRKKIRRKRHVWWCEKKLEHLGMAPPVHTNYE